MRILFESTLDGVGVHESNTRQGPNRRFSKILGLMRRVGGGLILALLIVSGQGSTAFPFTTNKVVLKWDSLGLGAQYHVETSTNLLLWTTATNTTATNVSLTFIGDKSRMFRLSVSNAPPKSVTLAWDPSPATYTIANYNVYYGTASRAYSQVIPAGTNATLSISNLVSGTTYYFAVTAVDIFGLESDYSSEISALIGLRLKIKMLP